MKRRNFLCLLLGGAVTMTSEQAMACSESNSWEQCDAVPGNNFTAGKIIRPADCRIEFRLPQELLSRKGIVLANGSYDWTLRLITFNRNGTPRWQQAHKVMNQPSKTQGVYFGTTVATYITCDRYTGWYSSGPIRSCGPVTLRRVNWQFDWKQLEASVK